MKKSTLLLASIIAGSMAFGQSQRLVLVEAFSQASCGPCAAQNPALNATLAANTTKAVSIKYQTSWPGVDPMNAQNPTDVSTRVSYYGVTGVPDRRLDGNQGNTISNTTINNRYNTPSPFTLNVSHYLSSDFDSIYITVTATASQAFSTSGSNTLRLQVAMVEKEIKFCSPPGTNGETEFFSVMRKMYPNANGTILNTSWTNGQSATFNFSGPIPSYIYDLSQIAIVGFIQESGSGNSHRAVHQAGYSAPIPLLVDAGVASCNSDLPVLSCNSTFTTNVTLNNHGATVLNNVDIKYQVDLGPINTHAWTGNLLSGSSEQVTLPSITSTSGSHTLKVWTENPNGQIDYNPGNDMRTTPFNILGTGTPYPISEGFQNATFPPANWILDNQDGGATWSRVTNAGSQNSSASTRMLFYTSPAGQIDDLILPMIDMSSTNPVDLKFDVAYASYAGEQDRLKVMVSTDCGATWTDIYNKAGSTLATAPNTTSSFTPNASQWRAETVSLSQFGGNSEVLIQFRGISAYGNNLFVDNINIAQAVATVNIAASKNPSCTGETVTFTATPTNGGTSPSYQWKLNGNNISGATNSTYTTNSLVTGQVITCEMTSDLPNVLGNPATSSGINITVNPTPATPTITRNVNILTSSSPTGNQWFRNGNVITGATGQNYTMTQNGDYTVRVTLQGCPSDMSEIYNMTTIGINENQESFFLNIQPNPFSNIATISFTNAENQNVTITVFDSYGKQISQINKGELAVGEYTEQFDGSNLPAGIYFVNITAGNSSVTKKVSIAK